MMIHFKFKLPEKLGYSPDWCGECYVPKNPKVLFYDEQNGIGVASCDTTKAELDKNLTYITKTEAENLLKDVEKRKYQAGVFVDDVIKDKWIQETVGIEQIPAVDPETGEELEKPLEKQVSESKAKFCPICHRMVGFQLQYTDGSYSLKIGSSTFQGIPAGQTLNLQCNGHKAAITVDGKKEAKKEVEPEPDIPVGQFCPECHELLILRAKETTESAIEEYIPEAVVENYQTTKYRVYTCPNGHRVKEVIDGK
jgi:hypothetical protein